MIAEPDTRPQRNYRNQLSGRLMHLAQHGLKTRIAAQGFVSKDIHR